MNKWSAALAGSILLVGIYGLTPSKAQEPEAAPPEEDDVPF